MGKAQRLGGVGGHSQNVGPNLVTKFRLIQSSLLWECLTPTLGLDSTQKNSVSHGLFTLLRTNAIHL